MAIKFTTCDIHDTDVAVGYSCHLCEHEKREKERILSILKYAQRFTEKELLDVKDAHADARFLTSIQALKEAYQSLENIRKSRHASATSAIIASKVSLGTREDD